ncbi:MAG: hypothetical protein IJJ82_01050 [Clostridia bacterium]|nr:hypothetical protein [Clostridia bacterium]
MENASKALIIAGAILLSIVLITLGVLIIGRGQEAIEQTNIDDQVVSTWNQKFTQYAGNDVRGTDVNILINAVLSSNASCKNNGEDEKLITIYDGEGTKAVGLSISPAGTTPNYTKNCSKVTPGSKYTVSVTYGDKGYITGITIAKP